MWTTRALIVFGLVMLLCQLLLVAGAPGPIWTFDQVGSYFNGIFRSVVGPIFGLDDNAKSGNSTSN
ncbi:PREDICTED: uncharacterized protein LOC108616370 [Drosophila arizonae]|uniref:Uncharacterized protein LOC108616370 n=1 Tax=Drosophila arizonae TaxID=7263 RepID=A0ABM1PIH1_DROAR|nr:PREDICTED: uncharacterized protein LOC108616370 [Drosophila arizonae]